MERYSYEELNELQIELETFEVDKEYYVESMVMHIFADLLKYAHDEDLENKIANLTTIDTESEEFAELLTEMYTRIYSLIPEDKRNEFMTKINSVDFNIFFNTLKEKEPQMYWHFYEKYKYDRYLPEEESINALNALPVILQTNEKNEVYNSIKFFWNGLEDETKKEIFPDMLLEALTIESNGFEINRLAILDAIIKATPMQKNNERIKESIDKIIELEFSDLGIEFEDVITNLMSMKVVGASDIVVETFLNKLDTLDEEKMGDKKLHILGKMLSKLPKKSPHREKIEASIKEIVTTTPDISGEDIYAYWKIVGIDFCYSTLTSQELEEIVFKNHNKFTDTEFLKDYIEIALSEDEGSINNNRFIAHLYQITRMQETFFKSISDSDLDYSVVFPLWFKSMEIRDRDGTPDLTVYDQYMYSNTQMDEETFKQFMEDLAKSRILGYNIPEECCDYILNQSLIPESPLIKNIYYYEDLIERTIEQKSQYILEAHGIEDYSVRVMDFIAPSIAGQQSRGNIKYASRYVIDRIDGYNAEHINIMNHECRHACQNKKIVTASDYRILQDTLISLSKAGKYYTENYKYESSENDANIFGISTAYNMMKKAGNDLSESDKMKTKVELNKLSQRQGMDTLRKISNSKKDFLGNIFTQEVQKNPYWISEFPVLQIGFNRDGTRRPSLEILEEFDEKVRLASENHEDSRGAGLSIYSAILKERVRLTPETIFSDIGLLFDFKSDFNAVNKHRDFIIRNEILPAIFEWGKNGEIPFSDDDQEYKKDSFEVAVELMKRFAYAHQEDEISEEIMEIISPHITLSKEEGQSEIEKMRVISDSVNIIEYNEGTEALIKIAEAQKDKNKIPKKPENEREEF